MSIQMPDTDHHTLDNSHKHKNKLILILPLVKPNIKCKDDVKKDPGSIVVKPPPFPGLALHVQLHHAGLAMSVTATLVHHGLHQQNEEEAGADDDLSDGEVVAVREGVVVASRHSEVQNMNSRSGPQDVDDQVTLIAYHFQPVSSTTSPFSILAHCESQDKQIIKQFF